MTEFDLQETRRYLEDSPTEELQAIYEEHDESEWRPEVFDMIRVILAARGVSTRPSQRRAVAEPEQDLESVPAEVPVYFGEDEIRELVTVYEAGDLGLTEVAKSLLDGAGIPCLARGEQLQNLFGWGGILPGCNPVFGPVKICVRPEDVASAREILKELLSSD